MFGEGFLSDHLFDILGLLVAIGGIWFVVQQLREAKLASQMEGMLAMQEKNSQRIRRHDSVYQEMIFDEGWLGLDDATVYSRVSEDPKYREAYNDFNSDFELLGVLVRRKALDLGMAHDFFGNVVVVAWKHWKGVSFHRRLIEDQPLISEHWEWLAKEFENYAG